MANAISFLKEVFLTISLLFSMIFSPVAAEPYEAKNPEQAKLVFNVVSDVHVETNNSASYKNFKNVLSGLKANKSAMANVFTGDNTMNGQVFENFLFFSGVASTLDSETAFIALGNHDTGNGEEDYSSLIRRYTNYNNIYLKNKIDTPYYYRVVNGCYMIFLASEVAGVNEFFMSDEQIQWLQDTLALAGKTGNPIFVFSHHPLTYIMNENENLLVDMLSEYENVFHIHGHTHWNYHIYENKDVVCVNLPRVTETVDYAAGTGVVVEVYDNEVVFRERDFISGEWLGETALPLK